MSFYQPSFRKMKFGLNGSRRMVEMVNRACDSETEEKLAFNFRTLVFIHLIGS